MATLRWTLGQWDPLPRVDNSAASCCEPSSTKIFLIFGGLEGIGLRGEGRGGGGVAVLRWMRLPSDKPGQSENEPARALPLQRVEWSIGRPQARASMRTAGPS